MKRFPWPGLFLILAWGCAGLPTFSSEAEFLRAVQSQPARPALAGTGEIRIKSPEGLAALRFVFLLDPPEQLRIEALSPLGNLAFLLIHNREGLHLYFPPRRFWIEGETARELLRDYLPEEIDPEELVFLLHGLLPAELLEGASPEMVAGKRSFRLRLKRGEGTAEAEYSSGLRLKKLELFDPEGRLTSRTGFKDYRNREGTMLPARIEFFIPRAEGNTTVRIELNQVELHPRFEEDSFRARPFEP